MRRILLVFSLSLGLLPMGSAVSSPIPPQPELWVMAADGSDQQQVAAGYGVAFGGGSSSWSPDGTRLAFVQGSEIWIYDTRTDKSASLFDVSIYLGGLAWSPDGELIAFTGEGGLGTVEVATGEFSDLTDSGDNGPSWSPDGSTLAFIRDTDPQAPRGEIWLIEVATGAERKLVGDVAFAPRPEWSPEGDRILYSRYEGGVAVVDVSTGASHLLSSGYTTHAKWMHDGSGTAFNRDNRVFIRDETGEVEVARGVLWDAHPTEDLLLVSRHSDLFVVTRAGSSTPLTETNTHHESGGEWSPDGQMISFQRTRIQVLCDAGGPYPVEATILGTNGDDVLDGTPGVDVIAGLGGDDSINGRAGDDVICGDEGHDVLAGGLGADYITGGPGRDVLRGGRTRDVLLGQGGDDTIFGGRGHDELSGGSRDSRRGDDVGDGGPGRDACRYLQQRRSCER